MHGGHRYLLARKNLAILFFVMTAAAQVPVPGGGGGSGGGGGAPSGPAGGDLGGTYPNPSVVAVNATTVPTNSSADQVLDTTASATAAWKSVPNCGDSSHALAYNTSTHAFSCQSVTGSAGSPSFPVNPETATYQVLAADFSACKVISAASGTFTATLVASGSQPTNGQCIWVVNYGSGVVTVARSGQNINGAAANFTLPAASASSPSAAFVVSDGTNYFASIIGNTNGTVSSAVVAGTANQITATGTCTITTTGTCTLSIPSSAALPGSPTTTTQAQHDNSTVIATTAYTDLAVANAVAGVNPAVAVLAASTASLTGTYSNGVGGIGATFTITATGAFTLDGVSISTIGQRVLLKNQSSAFQNGVYTATIAGTTGISAVFTRALDYDTPSDINSTGAIPVQSGTVNATTSWLLTSTVNTVGTDALTYVQFSLAPTSIVTSVTVAGTTNQITATGTCSGSTTISCTLSLPSGLVLPGTIDGLTITTTTGTLTIANAKVLTVSNSLTLAGTDSTTLTFPTTSATMARTDSAQTFTGIQTFSSAPVMSLASATNWPDYYRPTTIWAANQNAGTGGNAWSLPTSSPCTVTARSGTNIVGGTLTCTSSLSAQFRFYLPQSWDTGVLPYIRVDMISSDATNAHTLIPTAAVYCAKGDGSTTDDGSFNTAQSLGTITLNGNANREWTTSSVQLNSTSMTGAVAGSTCNVKMSVSGSQTATNSQFYSATITIPEKLNLTGAQ